MKFSKRIISWCLVLALAMTTPALAANPQIDEVPDSWISTHFAPGPNRPSKYHSVIPSLQTVIGPGGMISVFDLENAKIHQFNKEGEFQTSIPIKREFEDAYAIGGFTQDVDGNYYVFHAIDNWEEDPELDSMVLVKYSVDGKRLDDLWFKSIYYVSSPGEIGGGVTGIANPFEAGQCRMEISGDTLIIRFASEWYAASDGGNHQGSNIIAVNIDSLEQLQHGHWGSYTVSHSFNQFVLPIGGGNFILVDQGDAGLTRSFAFAKAPNPKIYYADARRINGETFKGGRSSPVHYNYTFAEMGGLSPTDNGYIFLASGERNKIVETTHNDSRNLYLYTMDGELTEFYKKIWLTQYTDKETQNAVSPKIVKIGQNRHLIMWANYDIALSQLVNDYTLSWLPEVFMMIVDDEGNIVTPATEIPEIALNGDDVLRYNPDTGNAYWAVRGKDGKVNLVSFNPDTEITTTKIVPEISVWAKAGVTDAISRKIVPQSLQSNYQNNITRQEFCQLAMQYVEVATGMTVDNILQLAGWTGPQDSPFTDTDDKTIVAAWAIEIVSGIGNGRFDPNGTLTREQAATMLKKTVEAVVFYYSSAPTAPTATFADMSEVSSWAVDSVSWATLNEIMAGVGNNRFDPKGTYTREQAIVTFNKIYTIYNWL